MVVCSETAIREQDMLLEIKEDLESRASSCRGELQAEVNSLRKHTQSTLTARIDYFCLDLHHSYHYSGYFTYLVAMKGWTYHKVSGKKKYIIAKTLRFGN